MVGFVSGQIEVFPNFKSEESVGNRTLLLDKADKRKGPENYFRPFQFRLNQNSFKKDILLFELHNLRPCVAHLGDSEVQLS